VNALVRVIHSIQETWRLNADLVEMAQRSLVFGRPLQPR
jgi:hypothetical protein